LPILIGERRYHHAVLIDDAAVAQTRVQKIDTGALERDPERGRHPRLLEVGRPLIAAHVLARAAGNPVGLVARRAE
jgi:hypothetical protein